MQQLSLTALTQALVIQGVVLDCIDSWSLHPYLLLLTYQFSFLPDPNVPEGPEYDIVWRDILEV